jgi:hypothetical protein
MRRQIDELEAQAPPSALEPRSRVRHQLDALREQEAFARAIAHQGADAFDETVEQFEARLRVAQSAVAGDRAEGRDDVADAVEDELEKWDAFIERLQAQAALRSVRAREEAEAGISDLRRRRNGVSERLVEVRAVSGEVWDEERQRLLAARDELERKADEMSARFR